MKKQITLALTIAGTALMASAMPYAVTDMQGLMPQATYLSTQWWKTLVLIGMCLGSIPVLWDRRLYPMPFALMGVACVVGTMIALPFVGSVAATKLLVPYGGMCFTIAIGVHLYFKHLDPINAPDSVSETH